MMTLTGISVSPGIAKGKVFLYKAEVLHESQVGNPEKIQGTLDQHARIKTAINDVRDGLETDARDISHVLDNNSGDIFRAQSAIVQDRSVIGDLEQYLRRESLDAEEAVRAVFSILASRFRGSGNESTRARGDDVEDISRRLLLSLRGIHAHRLEGMPTGSVLVARHLFPSDTVFLSRTSTVAVIAEFAGRAAHAALLARELGIPCIGGITNVMELAHTGDDIIVDGGKGIALIDADPELLSTYLFAISEQRTNTSRAMQIAPGPTITKTGIEVTVLANARSQEDVDLAMRHGADGIGLFRTEPFFMASKHLPSAQEFTKFLDRCLEPAAKLRINVRLLDVGADKNPIYLPLPPEPDPFLGMRGVRVLLRYPDLLDAQLRALLTCSKRFNIGILIPMVTLENDVIQVINRCKFLASEMGAQEIPPIGAMIETPSAALSVASLIQHVDFLSIGSNDLTQYTLAAGRENPTVSDYFIDDHPSIMRLMDIAIKDARNTPISLCGELAGRTASTVDLLKIGLRSFSVATSLISDVRMAIRNVIS